MWWKRKIIETADGSKTIQLVEWNEQYHSVHGALQEAEHVFIANLKREVGERKEINVFEMGFGTGLNAFLTLRTARELNIKVNYFSLEAYPVKQDEIDALDYQELLNDEIGNWKKLMSAEWEKEIHFSENFKLFKQETLIEDWREPSETFDFIFYDAFGTIDINHICGHQRFSRSYLIQPIIKVYS